jgi:hypothetical protein
MRVIYTQGLEARKERRAVEEGLDLLVDLHLLALGEAGHECRGEAREADLASDERTDQGTRGNILATAVCAYVSNDIRGTGVKHQHGRRSVRVYLPVCVGKDRALEGRRLILVRSRRIFIRHRSQISNSAFSGYQTSERGSG